MCLPQIKSISTVGIRNIKKGSQFYGWKAKDPKGEYGLVHPSYFKETVDNKSKLSTNVHPLPQYFKAKTITIEE